ncbi:hypothetical protein T484DRAFT_1872300 [Baffinella frigidus]|nr:hypothetical protein T484DRAFT_1872300 [Cryptophyta sp. CCMP2293]
MRYTAAQLVEMSVKLVVDVLTAPDEPAFATVLAWAGAWAVIIAFCAAVSTKYGSHIIAFCTDVVALATGGVLVAVTTQLLVMSVKLVVDVSTAPDPLATAAAWGGSLAAFIHEWLNFMSLSVTVLSFILVVCVVEFPFKVASQVVEMSVQLAGRWAVVWGVLAFAAYGVGGRGAWAVIIAFCAAVAMRYTAEQLVETGIQGVVVAIVATAMRYTAAQLVEMSVQLDAFGIILMWIVAPPWPHVCAGGVLVAVATKYAPPWVVPVPFLGVFVVLGLNILVETSAHLCAWGGKGAAFIAVAIGVVIVVASSFLVVFIVVARLAAGETTRAQLVDAIVQILPFVTVAVMFECFGYGAHRHCGVVKHLPWV